MAFSFQVNGTATISCDTGSSRTLEQLGQSVDGVDITWTNLWKDVFIDETGDAMPADKIYKGMLVFVELTLVLYDPAVFGRLTLRQWNGNAQGALGTLGQLAIQNGLYSRIVVASPVLSQPLNFLYSVPVDDTSFKLNNTDNVMPKYKFQSLWSPQYPATTNSVIFNNVTS